MRRWPWLVAMAAVWASALSVVAPSAQAVAPEATGWWWSFEAGQKQNPFPPGSLVVAAEPERVSGRETTVAALRLPVPDDTSVGELVLAVNTDRTAPKQPIAVQACPTNTAWKPEEAGPIANAPIGDCSSGFAYGYLDEDGKAMRFPVGGLVRDGYLNIVLMPQSTTTTATTPGTIPSTIPPQTITTPATTQPFEVVFHKPDANAIKVTTYPASGGGGGGGGGEEEFTNPFLDAEFTASIGITPPPYSSEVVLTTPAAGVPTAPASGPSRRSRGRSLPPASNIVEDRPERAPTVLLGMVLTGLVLLYLGLLGGSGPLRRLPGPFGRVLPEPEGELNRGIGRFARPRDRPPQPL